MDVMVGDRKVWTAVETRALIALKEEMKPKFQTMKRNRTLWIELSDKMRKHFGHERSPAQCAVRWKNIISAYKDSREALRNPRPDGKVCLFFKEVEAVLGDPPLNMPAARDGRIRSTPSSAQPFQSPRKSERSREPKDSNIAALLLELIAKVDAQGAAIARIEKMLAKAAMDGTTPAPEALQTSEPIPVPPPDNIACASPGASRPYSAGDSDALLERPSTTSVPDLVVSPETALHPNDGPGTDDSARPSLDNSVHNVPRTEQITREEGAPQPECAVGSLVEVVTGEVAVPVAAVMEGSIQAKPTPPSSVPIALGTPGNDVVAGTDESFNRTETATRSADTATIQQVVTAIPKPAEVQGSDGSVGGNAEMDLISTELGKEPCNEVPAAKKRKVAHT